jgi:hypothetical protein
MHKSLRNSFFEELKECEADALVEMADCIAKSDFNGALRAEGKREAYEALRLKVRMYESEEQSNEAFQEKTKGGR